MFDFIGASGNALYLIFIAISALVKASNVVVKTGYTGLVYTFGRASQSTVGPGLHVLIPFAQRARVVPTRSRTIDLPAQRIARAEGHVFMADANVVWRVVDVRRALIMVDDLVRGMEQMLTLGVQEVVRSAPLDRLRAGEELDRALSMNLEAKLGAWGVAVERAGFSSLAPTDRTLRITQLRQVVREREGRARDLVAGGGLTLQGAVAAVGTSHMFRVKARARRRREETFRHQRRIRDSLEQRGWSGAAVARAFRAMGHPAHGPVLGTKIRPARGRPPGRSLTGGSSADPAGGDTEGSAG